MITNPKFVPTGEHIPGDPRPISVDVSPKSEAMARIMKAGVEAAQRLAVQDSELGDLREARVLGEVEKRELEDILEKERTDPLTELPTRRIFQERLTKAIERAERGGATFAVFAADARHLNVYNNHGERGHKSGDDYLVGTARALERTVRAGDTVARIGGDEFAGILFGVDTAGMDIDQLAKSVAAQQEKKIAADLKADPNIRDSKFPAYVNIGIAFYQPGDTPESIVERADLAEGAAKADYYNALDPKVATWLAGLKDDRFPTALAQPVEQPQDVPPQHAA